MATKDTSSDFTPLSASEVNKVWNIYAIRAYAAIVARKHSLPFPMDDLDSLSNEELVSRLSVIRDLAHLPPG